MKFQELLLAGVFKVEYSKFSDERGLFVKNYNDRLFLEAGLSRTFTEQFYSESKKSVLRGMHFQLPPHDHDKLVVCISGKILDVILDLRTNSKTFGGSLGIELSAETPTGIFIPKGCAHGFYTLSDSAIVHYSVTTDYSKESDSGVKWDSFNFAWPCTTPIISERDSNFLNFQDFQSPFI